MKNASLISCFLFSWNFSVAQNLILNPGYEEYGEITRNTLQSEISGMIKTHNMLIETLPKENCLIHIIISMMCH